MNKFKIPALIFTAVFLISATALFFYIKKDVEQKTGTEVEAPAWVNENASSGKLPVSGKLVESGNVTEKIAENKTVEVVAEANKTVEAKPKTEPKNENRTVESTAEKVLSKIQGTVVTEFFLDNLASYIADSYHPAGSLPYNPKKGMSSASFKGINTHFGLNLRGLMPEARNLVSARKSIWVILLTPGTLEALYERDTAPLLDLIEEKGIVAERNFAVEGGTPSARELSTAQRAEMFRTSAQPLRHVAAVLEAISGDPDLVQALDSYIKAEKRVDSANGIFQLDLDNARKVESDASRNKASHSGKVLKEAITVREKIKNGISGKIKTACSGSCDNPNDSFYIAQWVFRRVHDNPKRLEAISTGSRILNDVADQMLQRADAIEKSM